MHSALLAPRRALVVVVAALATLGLALAPSVGAQTLPPTLNLGPITVADGTAVLTGNVGGTPTAETTLSVNGQQLGVDANGRFNAAVNLNGQSALHFRLGSAAGETAVISIPLTTNVLDSSGQIVPTVLDALRRAGVSINVPPGGFTILDGRPLTVTGSVLNPSELGSLKLNGQEILGLLRRDGSFQSQVPATSREVSITATDRQGVSQTSSFGTQTLSSAIRTSAGTSVAAAGAVGIRIAKVRYVTKGIRKTKRMRVIVTVRDNRGFLVRGARVILRGTATRMFPTLKGRQTKATNTVGQASFSVKMSRRASGRRFVVATLASTPTARTSLVTSVRVPRFARRARTA